MRQRFQSRRSVIKRYAVLMPDETYETHGTYVTGLSIGVEPGRGEPEHWVGRYLSVTDVHTSVFAGERS
jgi:hypothetical protein